MIARPAVDSSHERRRFAAVVGLSVLWHLAVVAAIGFFQPFERARETGVEREPISVEMVTRRDFVLARRQEVAPAAERPETAVDPAAEDGPEAPQAPAEAARPRAAGPTSATSAEPPVETEETRPEAAPLREAAPSEDPQETLVPSRQEEASDLAAKADDAAPLAAVSEDPATAASASESPEPLASASEPPAVATATETPERTAAPSPADEPREPVAATPEAPRTVAGGAEPQPPVAPEAEAASPSETQAAEVKRVQEAAPSAAEVTVEADGLRPTGRQAAEARPSDAAPASSAKAPPPRRAATASDDVPPEARAAALVPDPAGVSDADPEALRGDDRIAAVAAAEGAPSPPVSEGSLPRALAAHRPDPADAGARATGETAADLAQTGGGPDPLRQPRQTPEAAPPADPASTVARAARVAASPTQPERPSAPNAARQATRQATAKAALDTPPEEAPSREETTPPDLRPAKDAAQPPEAAEEPSRVAQAASLAATPASSPSAAPRPARRTAPSEAIAPAAPAEVAARAEPARQTLSSGQPPGKAAPAKVAAEPSAVSPAAGDPQVARAPEAGGTAASLSAASGTQTAMPANGTPARTAGAPATEAPATEAPATEAPAAEAPQTRQAPSRLLARAPADSSALAPRRATPEEAAGRSATLGGMLSQVLATMPCAHATLEAGSGDGRLALRGYVPSADGKQRVLARMTELLGSSRVEAGELAVVERPHCATLSGIAETGIDHHPALDGKGTATGVVRRYLSDDSVRLKLTTPEFPAYLYVDYFDRQGWVIHLVPNLYGGAMRFDPDSTVGIGGDDRLTAAPPYGIDLVVAVASSKPLFNEMRPRKESAERYLDALRNAIARRRSADAWQGAYSYILVEMAPRLGGRAQAEGG